MNVSTPRGLDAGAGLRLALFAGNYNFTRDGANQALNRLAAHLLSRGVAVRVYSPTSRSPAFEHAGDLVPVPSTPIPGRGEYRLALPMPRRIRRDLAQFSPTVIHLSAPDLLGVQAQRLGQRLSVPVVASLHTRFETYLSYYGLEWLRPGVERRLATFYRGCDRVLAPNGPMAELLRRDVPDRRVRIWRRGIDRVQFSPTRRDLAWRRSIGLADEDLAVLFLGRLVLEKGLDVFARTFHALADAPHIRPLVVGDGPARSWLKARLPPGCLFTGFLSGAALGRAVASADVMFNPSRTEAFGNATLEAMAAGLPVVALEAPSTRELVTSGEDGWLAAAPTAHAYADALRRLAADAQLRARMGAAARRTSARYDWAASGEAVLDVYRELAATPAEVRARG